MELLRAILFYRTSSCFGIEKLSNGNAGLHENRRLYGPAGATADRASKYCDKQWSKRTVNFYETSFRQLQDESDRKLFKLIYREGIAHSDTSFFYEWDELWSIYPSRFRLPILWHCALFYDVTMKNRYSIIDKFWYVTAFMAGMDLYLSSKHSFCHLIKFFQ